MKFVLDTSAWYAFIAKDDRFHQQAKDQLTHNTSLVVPYPVFEELAALVHKRLGKRIVNSHVGRLMQSTTSEIIYISAADNQDIWKIYQSHPNWLDYVDASCIWLSRKLDLPIFTFDQKLRQLLDVPFVPK